MILLAAACAMPGPYGRPPPEPELASPRIASYALDCDLDAETWTLSVEATSWSGGGKSYWTVDGAYVEEHVVDAISYEPDGTGESLLAEIGVVADWRLLGPRSTAFTCGDDPDVLFRLWDLEGEPVDCRTSGPDPAVWARVQGVGACPEPSP